MSRTILLARRLILAGSALALLVAARAAYAADAPAGPSSADKVELMLKEGNLFYQRIETPGQPTVFKVVFQDSKNRTSILLFKILPGSWKYNDNTSADLLWGFTQTIAQAKLPASVGAKVAEYNDSLIIGGGSLNADAGVYCYTGAYIRGLDFEQLSGYIANLHFVSVGLKDALDPIIKAAAAEN